MQEIFDTGYFVTSATQYTCVTRSSSGNRQCATSTANQRVAGVLAKTVAGTSTVPVYESIQTVGETYVYLASGETVVNGSPLKVVNSSGHAGLGVIATDRVFGFAVEGQTGPCLIRCQLALNTGY